MMRLRLPCEAFLFSIHVVFLNLTSRPKVHDWLTPKLIIYTSIAALPELLLILQTVANANIGFVYCSCVICNPSRFRSGYWWHWVCCAKASCCKTSHELQDCPWTFASRERAAPAESLQRPYATINAFICLGRL